MKGDRIVRQNERRRARSPEKALMMRAGSWLRAGLIFLAIGGAGIGSWAYILPHHFYNDVLTVAMDPPFSQQL